MKSLGLLRQAVREELGEANVLATDQEIERWLNDGQDRLTQLRPVITTLSWAQAATTVTLPTDYVRPDRLVKSTGFLPSYNFYGKQLVFNGDGGAADAGTATLFYWARWPEVTSSADSILDPIGDQACVSYACYRFFKKLASSRSDYRQYATVTGANGVDISELDALSERHYTDFTDARDELHEELPELFYAEDG